MEERGLLTLRIINFALKLNFVLPVNISMTIRLISDEDSRSIDPC